MATALRRYSILVWWHWSQSHYYTPVLITFSSAVFPSLTSRRTWIFCPHVSPFNRLGYLDPLQLSSCRSLLIGLSESSWVLPKRSTLAYAILVSWIPFSGMSLTTSSLLKVHTCVHSPPPRTFRSTTFPVFRRGRQLPRQIKSNQIRNGPSWLISWWGIISHYSYICNFQKCGSRSKDTKNC